MTSLERNQLFVYGSLKRGFPNHAVLGGARWHGPARTAPAYRLGRLSGYPVLCGGGSLRIAGELYSVSASELAALDEFEGAAYERRLVALEDGTRVQAYFASAASAREAEPLDCDEWVAEVGAR